MLCNDKISYFFFIFRVNSIKSVRVHHFVFVIWLFIHWFINFPLFFFFVDDDEDIYWSFIPKKNDGLKSHNHHLVFSVCVCVCACCFWLIYSPHHACGTLCTSVTLCDLIWNLHLLFPLFNSVHQKKNRLTSFDHINYNIKEDTTTTTKTTTTTTTTTTIISKSNQIKLNKNNITMVNEEKKRMSESWDAREDIKLCPLAYVCMVWRYWVVFDARIMSSLMADFVFFFLFLVFSF